MTEWAHRQVQGFRDQAVQGVILHAAPGGERELCTHTHGKLRALEEVLALIFGEDVQ